MKRFVSKALFSLIIFCTCSILRAQQPEPKLDSSKRAETGGKPKSYRQVIPSNSKTQKGLLTIHLVDEQYYFEIPFSLFDNDLLVVTRIAKGAIETDTYAGDEITNMVVRFEKGQGNRVLIRKVIFTNYTADSLSPMYQSVMRSSVFPILSAFPVEAYSPDGLAVVIKANNFILEDNELFSLNVMQKGYNNLSSLAIDKSYISDIQSYSSNIEIGYVKTYTQTNSGMLQIGNTVSWSNPVTVEMNTSIILLPEKMMQQRFADPRVGYFYLQEMDYDANPNGIKLRSYIKRWRLEPKPEDLEKYNRGELVEAMKPIVFYIDPATPQKWVPFIILGVNDWNEAFEQAGFKNAIVAKRAPSKVEDSTWSLYEARHSAIVYKPSQIENASGPSIADPRTGEILESHINWYHNVISLIHDWYMVQCGAVDPKAQKMVFDDSLMGQLIRFVVSHEVGHTLGLTHNMRASSTVPVEKLRDKEWVEKNGFCPSIMDYARFNYVAQPEDSIEEKGLMPRIGLYDKWAIEWGYRLLPKFKKSEDELSYLDTLVKSKMQNDQYVFGSEHNWGDPKSQSEDIGDNAMLASSYGIKNLKRILPRLITWTAEPHEGYNQLDKMYKNVQQQYQQYLVHVVTNIFGIYETIKNVNQFGP
ncbi:MAG: zinc-dependent metalloprotease, partial [Flavisolibacter sp.]